MRRMRTLARRRPGTNRGSFAFALRHRAFAARLRSGREGDGRTPTVAYVLRRTQSRVLQLVRSPLSFALNLIHRTSAPGGEPQRRQDVQSPKVATLHTNERLGVVMRIMERMSLVSHFRESRLLVGAALPQPVPAMTPVTAESSRIQMIRRIERQLLFPRVTQVVARAPAPVAVRSDTEAQTAMQAVDVRAVLRSAPPLAATLTAAALPPAELSRVTDHVIQQLDRRVLSYRERMGRI